jgi:hypothetical protein
LREISSPRPCRAGSALSLKPLARLVAVLEGDVDAAMRKSCRTAIKAMIYTEKRKFTAINTRN